MRLIIYFFTNQIIYRRRGARISGKSLQGFNYENSTSSAEVLTKHHLPLLSPRLPSSVTAAATGISRTDHGAFTVRKLQPPPSRNPRSDSWSRFSWRNVWLLHYEKHNTINYRIIHYTGSADKKTSHITSNQSPIWGQHHQAKNLKTVPNWALQSTV